MVLTYVYTYHSMEVEDITVDGIFTVGEKMSTALMNTVMGISIVFLVLIIICLLICCFNIFPYLEKKKAAKTASKEKEDVVSQIEAREEQQADVTDDVELIAVIAAAIAAAEGTSTDGFVVRSIRRR